MKTYIVHPVVDNHIWITTKYKSGRKEVERIAFQIDCPGKWYDEEYNCHVDGCDYPFATVDEALEHGAKVLQFNGEPYKYVHTDKEYNIYEVQV